ncbi:Saccharopine dehydrogenase-domain-containing protein [Talaromyces proteolyticus]|uniref:Saccharopine dehydrogenase-domain-containing protein n=1 Tax=Talaromyces proteolyticus TaxID=1131652 RepID=A0AAD4PXA0_9EURO|nr:Saccharopine dehydrogenase-domain-containing protein [Talaromyces proteolyticus]KAH8696169.1 Saccharopine dehydrogenase-domain-containing protein [Talaromyces proteolyticus]
MTNTSNTPKPVIFIGAADAICGEAIRFFVKATDVHVVLADADEDALRRVAAKLPGRNITTRKVDIFNPNELRSTIAGAALVIQGAQPYYRTSTVVLTACIDAKVPYLDYSDDVHSTQESLNLHERAKKEGISCYINCGASPGMTNLFVVEIPQQLDTVDSLDICWLVSEEGGDLGREVLVHLMHITGGPCLTWDNGKAAIHENWIETSYAPFVHPESVTLPRRLPNVNRIRTSGALNPAPFNGFARGLGAAVNSGTLSMDVAVDFLQNMQRKSSQGWSDMFGVIIAQFRGGDITLNDLYQLDKHGVSSLKPWNLALWGMIDQVRKGECTSGERAPHRSGLLVRGVGTRNGQPAVVIRRTPTDEKDPFLGEAWRLRLEHASRGQPGVYCPEDWAEPEAFFTSMQKLGCPQDQIVESVNE